MLPSRRISVVEILTLFYGYYNSPLRKRRTKRHVVSEFLYLEALKSWVLQSRRYEYTLEHTRTARREKGCQLMKPVTKNLEMLS